MASYRDCAAKLGLSKEINDFLAGDGNPGATDDFRRKLGEKHQEALVRQYQANLQEIAVDGAAQRVAADPRGAHEGAIAYYTMDDRRVGFSGVEQEVRAVQNYYLAQFNDQISLAQNGNYLKKIHQVGETQNKQFGRDMAKEAFGETSGNANARTGYEQFAKIAEAQRTKINELGGNIKKLNSWNLPQRHSDSLLTKGGIKGSKGLKDPGQAKQQWVEFIEPLIKPFADDNGNVLPQPQQREILESSFDAIITNGASRRASTDVARRTKLANRGQESREFHFLDSDSWLRYAEEYGEPDITASMIQHIEDNSRNIAMMRSMGPDPDATHNVIRSMVQHESDMNPGNWRKQRGVAKVDAIWDNVNGMPQTGSQAVAVGNATVRSIGSGAKLGGAVWSSLPDPAFAASSVLFNGTGIGRWGKHWVQQHTPGMRKAGQEKARATGWMVDNVVSEIRGTQRFADPEVANFFRDFNTRMHKASLMTPWENGQRTAFNMATVEGVSAHTTKPLSEAPARLQYAMKRAGITEADWAQLKAARNPTHGNIIDNNKLDLDLAAKFGGWVHSESAGAVILPTARTRATMNRGLATGTAQGEAARYMTQWMSHPIAYTQSQVTRQLNMLLGRHDPFGPGLATAFAVGNIAALGTLGMISVQTKEVAKGRTPFATDSAGDWARLFQQGLIQAGAGGLWYETVYGVLFNGRNPLSLLTPPTLQAVDEILGAGIFADVDNEGMKALDGRLSEYLGGAAVRAMGWVPGQSLWYLRATWEQVIMQQVADQISEEEARKMHSRSQRLYRDRGQEELLR